MKTTIIVQGGGHVVMTAGSRQVSVRVSQKGRINVRVPSNRRDVRQGPGRYFATFDAAIDAYQSPTIKAILLRAKGELLDCQLAVLRNIQRPVEVNLDGLTGDLLRTFGARGAAARLQAAEVSR
jgi:hypothetical protein